MTDQTDPFFGLSPDFVHAEAATAALGRRQILLVPGAEVAVLTLDLPPKLRGQAREQVARRQLRDRLGPGADRIEMRPFPEGDGAAWTRVLVAARAHVDGWRAQAGQGGRAVLPDYLALPTAPGVWTVTRGPSGLAVRLGPWDGFGGSDEVALALFERALRDVSPLPSAVLALGPGLSRLTALATARGIPVETSPAAIAARGLPAPALLAHGEEALDLRRDPQVARSRLARRVLVWRWPMVLGLLAAGLWAASQILLYQRLEAETARLTAETTALVRESFVPTGPILDVRIQVSRALAERRAATETGPEAAAPLALLNRAAIVLAARGARPESLRYTEDGVLVVAAEVADFAEAEALAQALRDDGLQVEPVDTSARDGVAGVRTELRLRAGEGPR
ncbi:type II secretion system protein GspL [Jannaschia seohaensis]|uniref:type II secretion system protein GspL n=1 Tax=Jannaschia seohaensis TaxID=475081 RepID=UPI0014750875|nr:type II secretion system protein GspL [Jannaschia seohaensis]